MIIQKTLICVGIIASQTVPVLAEAGTTQTRNGSVTALSLMGIVAMIIAMVMTGSAIRWAEEGNKATRWAPVEVKKTSVAFGFADAFAAFAVAFSAGVFGFSEGFSGYAFSACVFAFLTIFFENRSEKSIWTFLFGAAYVLLMAGTLFPH